MALYIVQHGLSLPPEIDPERGLSEEGQAEVEKIAAVAAGYGVKVSSIVHSGKKRARQTAEILAHHLHPESVMSRPGIEPLDAVEPVADSVDAGAGLMLVGHLPFLERLVSYLILGKTAPRVFKLQNGGILCMDKIDEAWAITWALMPHIG